MMATAQLKPFEYNDGQQVLSGFGIKPKKELEGKLFYFLIMFGLNSYSMKFTM